MYRWQDPKPPAVKAIWQRRFDLSNVVYWSRRREQSSPKPTPVPDTPEQRNPV